MRLLLVALLPFALTGCWEGANLYATSDARSAIPAGVYTATKADEQPKVFRISTLPDGMTQFDGGDEKDVYGFAVLDRDKGTFVGWMQPEGEPPEAKAKNEPNQAYGLMVRKPDGSFFIYLPDCKEAAAEIARNAGAAIANDECNFPTRGALENALRLLPQDENYAMRLVRVP
jgi:hypothetical protein